MIAIWASRSPRGRHGDAGTRGRGEDAESKSPRLRVSASPRRLLTWKAILLAVLPMTAAAQQLSDLEAERPIALEDARPISAHAFSGSADWTYNVRKVSRDDYGPGFSLLYGLARRLEVGASVRYVTSPGTNARRGISSGDIQLHALYGVGTESASLPAFAVRVGVEFPT